MSGEKPEPIKIEPGNTDVLTVQLLNDISKKLDKLIEQKRDQ